MSEERPVIERHIQTIVGGLILAAVLWVGTTLSTMSTDVTALQVEIRNLKSQISDLQDRTHDRYTKFDAAQDLRNIRDILAELKGADKELRSDLKNIRERIDKHQGHLLNDYNNPKGD